MGSRDLRARVLYRLQRHRAHHKQVLATSPAAKAGFKTGDAIKMFGAAVTIENVAVCVIDMTQQTTYNAHLAYNLHLSHKLPGRGNLHRTHLPLMPLYHLPCAVLSLIPISHPPRSLRPSLSPHSSLTHIHQYTRPSMLARTFHSLAQLLHESVHNGLSLVQRDKRRVCAARRIRRTRCMAPLSSSSCEACAARHLAATAFPS